MPSFQSYAWRRLVAKVGTLLLAVGFAACGAGGKLTTDRAYSELKPKEQLPERELRELPDNLLVKIDNVADAGKSYQNYVALYINGREVAPIEKLTNMTSTYSYPLRLQHGVYEVRAEYHAVGYWREQTFDIKTDEAVKIIPGQRTILTCRLDKDHRGRPLQKNVQFRMQYETLAEASQPVSSVRIAVPSPAPAVVEPPVTVVRPVPLVEEVTPRAPEPRTIVIQPAPSVERVQPVAEPRDLPVLTDQTLTLQINTTPSGADVIIDDRYVGQSPLKVAVTANQNHVVQISRPGHQEIMKVIDAKELRGQNMLQLLVKLEPVVQQQ
jgi:hypothetical protein